MAAKLPLEERGPHSFNVRLDKADLGRLDAWVEEVRGQQIGASVTRSSLARGIIQRALAEHDATKRKGKR